MPVPERWDVSLMCRSPEPVVVPHQPCGTFANCTFIGSVAVLDVFFAEAASCSRRAAFSIAMAWWRSGTERPLKRALGRPALINCRPASGEIVADDIWPLTAVGLRRVFDALRRPGDRP
jgi:hypothetical protein